MRKKIYSIISIIISIMFMFLIQNEVFAASATISASETKVEPGKTVTITANIKSSASWALDVSTTGGTLKKNDSRVGNTDSGNNEDKTVTLGTFSTETVGTYKITLSGYVVDGDTFSKTNINESVSIVVEATPDPEPPSTDDNTQTQTPSNNTGSTTTTVTTTTKSSEARLSNLGIRPNDFSGFSKNTSQENWSATVPNDVAEVEVYATAKDSKAKVEGTGKVTLKEGSNTVKVKVTAEDGTTTKTYTLTINRKTAAEQAKEDGEARLKILGIKPEEYDFTGFDSEKTEYSVEVPNEVEEIEIYATAMNSSAQITGTGMITLEEGLNELKIESIAIDGTKKTYILNVTRKESEEIVTNTEDIKNEETEENATEQIIVNNNETVVEEKVQMSWLKPETWGKEEIIKIAIIVVLIILIIIAIILKINISKEHKVGLPGADELDKAIAEHQELSEGNNYSEEIVENDSQINYEQQNEGEQNYIEEIAVSRFGIEEDSEAKTKRRGRHF